MAEERLKGRVLEIVQRANHPETGEVLMTEEQIKHALEHKTIGRWAYVLHDKDVITEERYKEIIKDDPDTTIKIGDPVSPHWDIVIEGKTNSLYLDTVAKWFNVPESCINKGKNKYEYGAFMNLVEYITHEAPEQQAKGKHRYSDEEIRSNFDFRDELNKRAIRKAKYGRDVSPEQDMLCSVLFDGMTLKEVRERDMVFYEENRRQLQSNRAEYISREAKLPPYRLNFYVCGNSGDGKSFMSMAMARSLIDPEHQLEDDEIFFVVGEDNATFEGYDGQPVIIWDDTDSRSLISKLHSRRNIYQIFDPYPKNQRQNIKYSSVKLINRINIVNSTQNWIDFITDISGTEDTKQAYRRFPFFIVVHESDYDMLVNRGYLGEDDSFKGFYQMKNIQGSIKSLIDALPTTQTKQINELSDEILSPLTQKADDVVQTLTSKEELSAEDIDKMSEHFGEVGSVEEVKVK